MFVEEDLPLWCLASNVFSALTLFVCLVVWKLSNDQLEENRDLRGKKLYAVMHPALIPVDDHLHAIYNSVRCTDCFHL